MFLFLKPIFSFLKKAFLVVAVYFIVINLFSHFINKDKVSLSSNKTDPIKQNRAEIYKVINDKELNKTKEGKMTIALYKMSMCSMIGEACTDNPADADKNYGKSVFGFMSNLIIIPYANPPASGVMWAYEGLQSAGFVPKTMAAEGIGFAAIKPFANLWKIFRDLSYMLLVIVLIAIGFMIMFRAKINPQTVISVENALPKIVISLILITFSFAIAGFMIDLMYVLIIIIISVLSNGSNNYNATQFQNEYIGASFSNLFSDVSGGHPWFNGFSFSNFAGMIPSMTNAIAGLFPFWVSFVIKSIFGLIFSIWVNNSFIHPIIDYSLKAADGTALQAATFGGSVGNLISGIFGTTTTVTSYVVIFTIGLLFIFNFIIFFLFFFSLLYLVFRIFALLFSSYIKLLLLIIISPILLIFEAIPGKNVFSWWLKSLIGNLIAFPITISMFLLGYIIINSSTVVGYNHLTLPYLNGLKPEAFKILIGVGLIMLIPDLVKLAKEALGIKDLPINLGMGTFFGGAAAAGGGAFGLIGQIGSISLGASALGINIPKIFGAKEKPHGGANPPDIASQLTAVSAKSDQLLPK